MLKLLAAFHHVLNQPAQPQSYSQDQLIKSLFHQHQCPHCNATNTVTVIPGSEMGAFDFDLSCSACATEYEVRPTASWCKYPQEITMHVTRDRVYTLQPELSTLETAVTGLQLESAFNG